MNTMEIITKKLPNTACTGQVRAFAHTFGEAAQNGGFGAWWFCPPIPALAGNASRWAAERVKSEVSQLKNGSLPAQRGRYPQEIARHIASPPTLRRSGQAGSILQVHCPQVCALAALL